MTESEIRRILLTQFERHPAMQVEDLYKLVHQAAMGSEHAVRDPGAAAEWLERELKELQPAPPEPMVDAIAPAGAVVRVHLRPFIQADGDPEELVQAFVKTANAYPGSRDRLREYWRIAEHLAGDGELPFSPQDMQSFFLEMERLTFPAVHHSPAYEQAYHPAYRVIAGEFLPGSLKGHENRGHGNQQQ